MIGSTDDIGLLAANQPQSAKNRHATILTALGINPDDLFFDHAGHFNHFAFHASLTIQILLVSSESSGMAFQPWGIWS